MTPPHTFRKGQLVYDRANDCYVKVEGRNDPYVELRYWNVIHLCPDNTGHSYAVGLKQIRPLTKREVEGR